MLEVFDGVHDLRRLREEAAAGRRQRHSGRRALEEGDAEALFQRLDVPGDRGLAQMQRLGRSREVTELCNGHESAQLIRDPRGVPSRQLGIPADRFTALQQRDAQSLIAPIIPFPRPVCTRYLSAGTG